MTSTAEPLEISQKKKGIADVFSRAAPMYDKVGPQYFAHFGRKLVEHAQVRKGARVLDIATGKGAVLFPAAKAVGEFGHVTGVDLADAMVQELSKEIAQRMKPANAEVLKMDAEHLMFPDASFDFILCGFGIFFFPQIELALSEMRRVLKSNGRIGISTWDKSFMEAWGWFNFIVKDLLPDTDTSSSSSDEPQVQPLWDNPDGMNTIMTSAGFTDIHIAAVSTEFVYKDEEEWWSSLWSHGARAPLEEVEIVAGPEGLAKLKAAAFHELQPMKQADGIHQLFPVILTSAVNP